MIKSYIRMWPREVFGLKDGNKPLKSIYRELEKKPGIYILYQNGQPYYVGQAKNLWKRIRRHAGSQNAKYYHHWTHFSAFFLSDTRHINELEGLVISAFGTSIANSSQRRMKRILLPKDAARRLAE